MLTSPNTNTLNKESIDFRTEYLFYGYIRMITMIPSDLIYLCIYFYRSLLNIAILKTGYISLLQFDTEKNIKCNIIPLITDGFDKYINTELDVYSGIVYM